MTDSFPRQNARTRHFTLGAPRSFQVSPDGRRVIFLRSQGGTDPVTCLWQLDTATGQEELVADPAALGAGHDEDPAERARRERSREQAAGIVAVSCDAQARLAVFAVAGQVYVAGLTPDAPGGPGVRPVPALAPAADPRPDPAGTLVAYACGGSLRVIGLAGGSDRVVAGPEGAGVTHGLAEFIAAEEMRRMRGYWWAPDSSALLVARVDENPVPRWFIADPADPATAPAQVRYPAAGTQNADVTLAVVRLDGRRTEVSWDRAAYPYLAAACWQDGGPPLLVVQSRDQRRQQLLAVDAGTGATSAVRDESDPHWLNLMPGVPARTGSGRIVWTSDEGGTRRLIIGTDAELAAGQAGAATPDGLQVREVLGVDGETVLFTASGDDPVTAGLWAAGPDGLTELSAGLSGAAGVHSGHQAGGTTVLISRTLDTDGAEVRVHRPDQASWPVLSLAERPAGPPPRPDIFAAGPYGIRTAILLPSGHQPGSAKLPVLMSPYGGPHGQMVTASRAAYQTDQWLAEQGFAVVIADGRGTYGRGPDWDREVAGDLASKPLEDQVTALHAAAARCADLDTSRVAIRGWSFGGYLSALAVLRRPDVFHAAVAGAPVTEWRLYDTHYTERYLGNPATDPGPYDRCSLLGDAAKLERPLLIVHGLADDNVVVAHSLRLSGALLAAGQPHSVLPLTGVTHMATQEDVAENLLLLQVEFLHRALGRE
ncbi:MAG TPA: prolyl oligopeptidase family serine peptidase [Streptosporangiaceae bacterium]|jgi:dipeptidyl-peptidase 4|nr:prolyl oligopeptidase family serine peptidase [Streptosporangiaceae bacterium]